MSLPSCDKIQRMTTKRLFRKLALRHVPREIVERKKHGFAVPLSRLLRHKLKAPVAHALLDQGSPLHEWFHREEIERLWSEHQSGYYDHRKKIWTLFTLATCRAQSGSRWRAINPSTISDNCRPISPLPYGANMMRIAENKADRVARPSSQSHLFGIGLVALSFIIYVSTIFTLPQFRTAHYCCEHSSIAAAVSNVMYGARLGTLYSGVFDYFVAHYDDESLEQRLKEAQMSAGGLPAMPPGELYMTTRDGNGVGYPLDRHRSISIIRNARVGVDANHAAADGCGDDSISAPIFRRSVRRNRCSIFYRANSNAIYILGLGSDLEYSDTCRRHSLFFVAHRIAYLSYCSGADKSEWSKPTDLQSCSEYRLHF